MAYSMLDYASMLGDPGRLQSYTAAIKAAVTPDSTVLDLGTGMGYFAVLAARYGARKVYAIEPNPAIAIGRQLAKHNGVDDRIEWFQSLSTEVNLPEKVDIVVSDLRAVLPQNYGNIQALRDARQRHLKPGGILMPARDRLFVAPCTDEEAFAITSRPWLTEATDDVDLSAYEAVLGNSYISRSAKTESLIAAPQLWTEIDYAVADTVDYRGSLQFEVKRDAEGHGFFVWFESDVDPNNSYSFKPDTPVHVYGSAFFPWQEPIQLKSGDQVEIDLSVRLHDDDYAWTWLTKQRSDGASTPRVFKQSTLFDDANLSVAELRKRLPQYQTNLSRQGLITNRALTLIKEQQPVGEIAAELAEAFPEANHSLEEWLQIAGEISMDYSD